MQIALLHLSDLHLKTSQDTVLSRTEKIRDALHQSAPMADACVIIISGDVTFAGSVPQYEIALQFLNELREKVRSLSSIKSVHFVIVPGNHDCDFSSESEIRKYLLRDIKGLHESELQADGDIVQTILAVQKNFFSFKSQLTQSVEVTASQRLSYGHLIEIDGIVLKFHCLNTAWLSRKEELQAKLFIPLDAIEPISVEATVSLAVLHHPYNWLDANEYRQLRDEIEQNSDIVFTGHEHIAGVADVERFSGEHLTYVEGAALQSESGDPDSAFNVLLLDFSSGEQILETFKWSGNHYASKQRQRPALLLKNPARQRNQLRVNSQFVEILTDLGAGFTHKRVRDLRLPHLFVYPDLRQSTIDDLARNSKSARSIYSKDVLEQFRATPKVLVIGDDSSGKTALLKSVFRDLSTEFAPLLLSGNQLRGKVTDQRFASALKNAITEQYAAESIDLYLQLTPERCILFIDDYDEANLNDVNERLLFEMVCKQFGHVFIAASDFYMIRELTSRAAEQNPFKDFETFQIREFGHRLRAQIIHKWLGLGRESASETAALEFEVRATEKIITTLLGKNVVPAYPFNILTLLQMMESAQPHATSDGSYGFLYELLVKASLAISSPDGARDVEIKSTYTSLIAYQMYITRSSLVTESQLREIHDSYRTRYDITVDFTKIVTDLCTAKVLEHVDASYQFKYKHFYYYFVAKYYERSLKIPGNEAAKLRLELEYMADRLHNEELANIICFYLYLTQDWAIIRRLIDNANEVYSGKDVCDFETHVEFVNRIFKETPKMLLSNGDVEIHREEYRRRLDDAEERGDDGGVALAANAKYDETLADIQKINIAFKTLQVLGQVLRSSADTMEGNLKLEIAGCSYLLGLRTLRVILEIAETRVEDLRIYLSTIIKERSVVLEKELSSEELLQRTDEAVIWLTRCCAYGTLKKISYAVGHHHLRDTYERILKQDEDNTAIGLVDLSIKLDHFMFVPAVEIEKLHKKLRNNLFSYSLLYQMVADFLYLYRVDVRTLQRLGAMFEITEVTGARFILPDKKMN